MAQTLTTIGFDADDTLWQNEHFFKLTEARFAELLADHGEPRASVRTPARGRERNLTLYGFGIKGFTLSMIETAIEVTDGQGAGVGDRRDPRRRPRHAPHPVETLPHVRDTLEALAGDYRMVLITKGDLSTRSASSPQSGLGELFRRRRDRLQQDTDTYLRIFAEHGDGPERSMMVGNSLRSDVVPAIKAGSWGVYVPHELNWSLEHDDEPLEAPRYRQLTHLGELIALLGEIGAPVPR